MLHLVPGDTLTLNNFWWDHNREAMTIPTNQIIFTRRGVKDEPKLVAYFQNCETKTSRGGNFTKPVCIGKIRSAPVEVIFEK